MAETRDPDSEHSPYMRLPWPLVALGLFVVLAVVLGFGLWAKQNVRPGSRTINETTGAVPRTPEPTVRGDELTSTPVLLVVPAADVGRSTPTAPALLTSTATSLLSPTPRPTVEPLLAQEIGRAYVAFWNIRSQALLDLDDAHIADVMDGGYLANIQELIGQLRSERRAIKTQVSLNYTVLDGSSDRATVFDHFQDNSVYVEIGTEDPLTQPAAGELSVLYQMHRISTSWKVVDSVRAE
jgi:hypothetical protein